jgi:ankyrin repeat protein
VKIVQLLAVDGVDYDEAIEGAAENGHVKVVQHLLAKGAEPVYGLIGAARGGHTDMVKLMLSYPGINVNFKNKGGYTALDAAENFSHKACAELIRAAGGKRFYELKN